jgi:DNA-binding response OmpR family regulator
MEVKRKRQPAAGHDPPTPGPTEPSGSEAEGTASILVVDDDEAVRESTAAILRHEGFEVLEAADGTAAEWILASERIDVLLLDLHLGLVDGTAVLEALEVSSTVVIFSAFGYFDESDIRRQFGSVVFDSLHKPVPPHRLVAVIADAADHARSLGHETRVRPISPRKALGLAMAGLSRLTPETGKTASTSEDGPSSRSSS